MKTILTLIVGLCLLLPVAAPANAEPLGQIVTNANSLQYDQDTIYTVIALPENWKQNQEAVELVRAFEDFPELQNVRRETIVQTPVYGSNSFTSDLRRTLPEVGQGKPVLMVVQGDELLIKETAPTYGRLRKCRGKILDRIRERIRERVCPKPTPTPGPGPEPDDDVFEPLPDRPVDDDGDVVEDGDDMPTIIALGALGGIMAWGLLFRRGMR